MLTVFRCSTSYTVIIVLWNMLMEPVIALARWWPCGCLKCVSGLRRREETLNFLRCIHAFDLVLKYALDIDAGNSLQLFFYFIALISIVASVIGMCCFSCAAGFRLKFSRIALWRKRFQLDSRSDLTTNVLFMEIFVEKWLVSLNSYLFGLKSARIDELIFLFDDMIFFRCSGWVVFWSVL